MPNQREGKINKKTRNYILIMVFVVIVVVIIFYIFNNSKQNVNLDDSDLNISDDENRVLYSNTQNAVTLEIEDFNFVKIKEGHGKLNDMTISVTNKGVSDIIPSIYVLIYDEEVGSRYTSKKTIPISGILNASTGNLSHLKIPIDLDIWGIENNKNVKVALYNKMIAVVSINFKTNFEGEKGILQTLKSYLSG